MEQGIGRGRRILIVDDEQTFLDTLEHFLSDQGFVVETAMGLAEAKRLACRSFDLVLIDKNLPDGSGLQVAKLFSEAGADPELVLITGFPSVNSAVEAIRYGVADYLTKPFDLGELISRLNRVLTVQELKRRNVRLLRELQEKNEALQRDSLTKLYNHDYFHDCLQKEVMRSRRHGLEFSLLFLDIDRFKGVNDTFGHVTGDSVLLGLADILRGALRRSDLSFRLQENDIAARFGGDEFALILPQTPKSGAAAKAEALRQHIESSELSEHGPSRITISIGVSAFPNDGQDPSALIAAADSALYAAKDGGRNRIVCYTPGLPRNGEHPTLGTAELVRFEGLERVIAHRSFEFLYQPIVDTKAWNVFGYEALCRPTDGVFSGPEELINAAQRAGKTCNLGRLLRQECVTPIDKLPEPGLLFVNLHPHELNDPALVSLEPALERCKDRLVFEVTETAAIRDFDRARAVLSSLRKRGLRIALDDLGAGYSGLNSLSLLEPDFVKLGLSIVQGAHESPRAGRLLQHLLEFATGEGMKVIAEGVESREQLATVTDLGVHLVQGYFVAPPAPPFAELRKKRPAGARSPRRPRRAYSGRKGTTSEPR
jgi:diguanylate cyclase (GGDEF)-like protein